MRRDELRELHCIMPIDNLPSVVQHGILSRRLKPPTALSVADPNVQDRRSRKRVPSGQLLHDYANLYINGRNPMMFKRKDEHERLAVLRVSCSVLDLPEVLVTDQNAASDHVRFGDAVRGIERINRERVFARYWTHDDEIEQWRHKSEMCAEVLVPDHVPPEFVVGLYVSCERARSRVMELGIRLPTQIRSEFFFR